MVTEAAGDALLVELPNGEADATFVAPPNILAGFDAVLSKIDPVGFVLNPVELPPKMLPPVEDSEVAGPKMEFMLLLPPNTELFEEVAGILEKTGPDGVPPNGDDAGLIMDFPKTFVDDTGV